MDVNNNVSTVYEKKYNRKSKQKSIKDFFTKRNYLYNLDDT